MNANGTLRVAVAPKPVINSFTISSGNLVLSGTNGVPYANCYLLTSTNLALPFSNWARIATNVFDASGNFSFTNSLNLNDTQRFYLLQLP